MGGLGQTRIRTYGRLGTLLVVELYHASSTRATVRLVLDLGALDLTDRCEEIHQIFVAS